MIPMPERTFDLFVELLKSAPNIVTFHQLGLSVWKTDHVMQETIAQRVSLLRKALDDDSQQPKYIRTVRSSGYSIVGTVKEIRSTISSQPEHQSKANQKPLYAIISLITVTFIGWLLLSLSANSNIVTNGDRSQHDLIVDRALELLRVQQADETDRAITMLETALVQSPSNLRTKLVLSFALSTRSTKFRPRFDDQNRAETLAREVLAIDDKNPDAYHALGYALDSLGRVNEALSAYQAAYTINPDDLAAASGAANLMSAKGRFYDALKLETRSLGRKDSSRYAEVQIAGIVSLLGMPGTQEWFNRASALNPSQSVIVLETIEAMMRSKDYDQAEHYIENLSTEIRGLPRVQRLEGLIALRKSDTAKALELSNKQDHAEMLSMLQLWRG